MKSTSTRMMTRLLPYLALVTCFGAMARGGDLYWDSATNAGYQHGDGLWSDSKWTTSGTLLEGWSDGNTANLSSTAAGASTIMLDGMAVTCSGLTAGGGNYTLIVTNGGSITSTNGNFIWGYGSSTNRLAVLGGAGVTSRVSHAGTFWVGYAGNTHELIIDGLGVSGSAVVTNSGQFLVGYTAASSRSSRVTVRRGGRLIVMGGNLIVGRSGDYQEMVIEDGGLLTAGLLYLGNSGGHSNTLFITGTNTVVDQVPLLYVANDTNLKGNHLIIANGAVVTNVSFRIGNNCCDGNMLSVTNGGRLYTTLNPVNIGYLAATNNTGLVSGMGSSWDLQGNSLEIGDIGQAACSNQLLVADGGMVTNVNLLTVVSNNSLHLLGGTISAARVTLDAGSETIAGISGESGPGTGWGYLRTTSTNKLGGTLRLVVKTGFKPSGRVTFTIMTSSSGNISGTFANASNGVKIAAYAEDLVTEVGTFTVGITTNAVKLHPTLRLGTMLMVQ